MLFMVLSSIKCVNKKGVNDEDEDESEYSAIK